MPVVLLFIIFVVLLMIAIPVSITLGITADPCHVRRTGFFPAAGRSDVCPLRYYYGKGRYLQKII